MRERAGASGGIGGPCVLEVAFPGTDAEARMHQVLSQVKQMEAARANASSSSRSGSGMPPHAVPPSVSVPASLPPPHQFPSFMYQTQPPTTAMGGPGPGPMLLDLPPAVQASGSSLLRPSHMPPPSTYPLTPDFPMSIPMAMPMATKPPGQPPSASSQAHHQQHLSHSHVQLHNYSHGQPGLGLGVGVGVGLHPLQPVHLMPAVASPLLQPAAPPPIAPRGGSGMGVGVGVGVHVPIAMAPKPKPKPKPSPKLQSIAPGSIGAGVPGGGAAGVGMGLGLGVSGVGLNGAPTQPSKPRPSPKLAPRAHSVGVGTGVSGAVSVSSPKLPPAAHTPVAPPPQPHPQPQPQAQAPPPQPQVPVQLHQQLQGQLQQHLQAQRQPPPPPPQPPSGVAAITPLKPAPSSVPPQLSVNVSQPLPTVTVPIVPIAPKPQPIAPKTDTQSGGAGAVAAAAVAAAASATSSATSSATASATATATTTATAAPSASASASAAKTEPPSSTSTAGATPTSSATASASASASALPKAASPKLQPVAPAPAPRYAGGSLTVGKGRKRKCPAEVVTEAPSRALAAVAGVLRALLMHTQRAQAHTQQQQAEQGSATHLPLTLAELEKRVAEIEREAEKQQVGKKQEGKKLEGKKQEGKKQEGKKPKPDTQDEGCVGREEVRTVVKVLKALGILKVTEPSSVEARSQEEHEAAMKEEWPCLSARPLSMSWLMVSLASLELGWPLPPLPRPTVPQEVQVAGSEAGDASTVDNDNNGLATAMDLSANESDTIGDEEGRRGPVAMMEGDADTAKPGASATGSKPEACAPPMLPIPIPASVPMAVAIAQHALAQAQPLLVFTPGAHPLLQHMEGQGQGQNPNAQPQRVSLDPAMLSALQAQLLAHYAQAQAQAQQGVGVGVVAPHAMWPTADVKPQPQPVPITTVLPSLAPAPTATEQPAASPKDAQEPPAKRARRATVPLLPSSSSSSLSSIQPAPSSSSINTATTQTGVAAASDMPVPKVRSLSGSRGSSASDAIATRIRTEGLSAVAAAYDWIWDTSQEQNKVADEAPPVTPNGPEVAVPLSSICASLPSSKPSKPADAGSAGGPKKSTDESAEAMDVEAEGEGEEEDEEEVEGKNYVELCHTQDKLLGDAVSVVGRVGAKRRAIMRLELEEEAVVRALIGRFGGNKVEGPPGVQTRSGSRASGDIEDGDKQSSDGKAAAADNALTVSVGEDGKTAEGCAGVDGEVDEATLLRILDGISGDALLAKARRRPRGGSSVPQIRPLSEVLSSSSLAPSPSPTEDNKDTTATATATSDKDKDKDKEEDAATASMPDPPTLGGSGRGGRRPDLMSMSMSSSSGNLSTGSISQRKMSLDSGMGIGRRSQSAGSDGGSLGRKSSLDSSLWITTSTRRGSIDVPAPLSARSRSWSTGAGDGTPGGAMGCRGQGSLDPMPLDGGESWSGDCFAGDSFVYPGGAAWSAGVDDLSAIAVTRPIPWTYILTQFKDEPHTPRLMQAPPTPRPPPLAAQVEIPAPSFRVLSAPSHEIHDGEESEGEEDISDEAVLQRHEARLKEIFDRYSALRQKRQHWRRRGGVGGPPSSAASTPMGSHHPHNALAEKGVTAPLPTNSSRPPLPPLATSKVLDDLSGGGSKDDLSLSLGDGISKMLGGPFMAGKSLDDAASFTGEKGSVGLDELSVSMALGKSLDDVSSSSDNEQASVNSKGNGKGKGNGTTRPKRARPEPIDTEALSTVDSAAGPLLSAFGPSPPRPAFPSSSDDDEDVAGIAKNSEATAPQQPGVGMAVEADPGAAQIGDKDTGPAVSAAPAPAPVPAARRPSPRPSPRPR